MMWSGPHISTLGTGELRTFDAVVRSVGDQPSIGPSEVRDQSTARTSAAASPPPTGQAASPAPRECNVLMTAV